MTFICNQRKSKPSLGDLRIFPPLSALAAFCALLSRDSSQRLAATESVSETAAIAVIQHAAGNHTAGIVTFTAINGGVKVVTHLTGLTPGKHCFHIHEFGDISDSVKALRTGGHFDPECTHQHALVPPDHSVGGHRAGDMGNLVADGDCKARLEVTLDGVTPMEPANPIVGRTVIVRAKPDAGGQPTGNAGDRVGEGVIGNNQGEVGCPYEARLCLAELDSKACVRGIRQIMLSSSQEPPGGSGVTGT